MVLEFTAVGLAVNSLYSSLLFGTILKFIKAFFKEAVGYQQAAFSLTKIPPFL